MNFLQHVMLGMIFIISGCANMKTKDDAIKEKKILNHVRVAILVTDGFEQVELTAPRKALEDAGAETVLVSPLPQKVQGFHHDQKADTFSVDLTLEQARAENFDALLLPGGVANPDKLRLVPSAIEFIKKIGKAKKPIAAICHGPWTLINAELVKGRTVTSWPSLEVDLKNAGAKWVDKEVVTDQNLVTSRKPEDIPVFNAAMIELFAKSKK